jgi:two-component system sensor histidine kinase UhpB
VARHAQARRVDVTVTVQAGGLSLRVADDGRGITNEEKLGMNSLGLVGMRERVEQLGGSVDVQRGPKRGTTVTVSVPLTPPKA